MSQPSNPFKAAEQVAPKIKMLLFGVSGVGKTYLALTAPGKVAAIDTEGGMAFYARRAGKGQLSEFDVLQTKTYRDVQAAVQFIATNPTAYSTLVIDPVTVIYETLQDAAQIKRAARRQDPDADLEMLDWQRIKRSYKALMTELVNLPVHVIVVAREKDETERKGSESIKVGVKPDAEKGTAYFFDTVVRLVPSEGGREAVVLKDRTGTHALNARLENPTFQALFGSAIKAGRKDHGVRAVQDDNEAAAIDASDESAGVGLSRAAFLAALTREGIGVDVAQARTQALFPGVAGTALTDAQRADLLTDLLTPAIDTRPATDAAVGEPAEPTAEPSAPHLFDEATENELDAAVPNG